MFGIEPISPAYGRDYKNRKDLEADFNADKDFVTSMGQYINKSQLIKLGAKRIEARYANKMKCHILEIK